MAARGRPCRVYIVYAVVTGVMTSTFTSMRRWANESSHHRAFYNRFCNRSAPVLICSESTSFIAKTMRAGRAVDRSDLSGGILASERVSGYTAWEKSGTPLVPNIRPRPGRRERFHAECRVKWKR
ncbi:hypothetical protein EVAR_54656_1 [Eumeta japonica]|uniref:Uncharacterized protein n=1 Tax=Eumeta variegata TaxID=151549 RepID=A0A4C1X629_EUMVA|nr:hypothetical protein EVAR_54656_1 [Eumeta japonica]